MVPGRVRTKSCWDLHRFATIPQIRLDHDQAASLNKAADTEGSRLMTAFDRIFEPEDFDARW